MSDPSSRTARSRRVRRIGMLVPSTNTNAEPLTAAVLARIPDVHVFVSRFRLPPLLSTPIDPDVLGESVPLLADARPDVVAFHGTAGLWTGIAQDAELAAGLASATGAAFATTAAQSMLVALSTVGARRVSVVYPGTDAVLEGAVRELAVHGIEVVGRSVHTVDLTNPQIGALSTETIEDLVARAQHPRADAVICIGTNFRSGYMIDRLERDTGTPVLDSAVALAWNLVRAAGVTTRISGWGSLFAAH